jgi:hypothetical protein
MFFLCTFCIISNVFAQSKDSESLMIPVPLTMNDIPKRSYHDVTIGLRLGGIQPTGNLKDIAKPNIGFNFFSQYRVNKNIYTEIDLNYCYAVTADQTEQAGILFDGKYAFWIADEVSSLYIQSGIGAYSLKIIDKKGQYYTTYYPFKFNFGFNAGGGIDVRLSRILLLDLNILYNNYYESRKNSAPYQFVSVFGGIKFIIF